MENGILSLSGPEEAFLCLATQRYSSPVFQLNGRFDKNCATFYMCRHYDDLGEIW